MTIRRGPSAVGLSIRARGLPVQDIAQILQVAGTQRGRMDADIEVDGTPTPVGPGAIMYCGSNVSHGITNTGATPMTFYWSKWTARGFE